MGGFQDLAEVNNIGTSWVAVGDNVIAAGATLIFVSGYGGNEGLLQGFSYWIESEDYVTSPVMVVVVGNDQITTNPTTATGDVQFGLKAPITDGPLNPPFMFPNNQGIVIRKGSQVGLQVTNNEAVPIQVRGMLVGITWTGNSLSGLVGPGGSGSPSGAAGPGGIPSNIFCR